MKENSGIKALERKLEMAAGEPEKIAALNKLAAALYDDYPRALQLSQQAKTISEGDKPEEPLYPEGLADSLYNLGMINYKCNNLGEALSFSLPRKYSRSRCKKGVKGFTMKSSCAPYLDC